MQLNGERPSYSTPLWATNGLNYFEQIHKRCFIVKNFSCKTYWSEKVFLGSPKKKTSTSPNKKVSRKVLEEVNRMETSDPEKETEKRREEDIERVSQVHIGPLTF